MFCMHSYISKLQSIHMEYIDDQCSLCRLPHYLGVLIPDWTFQATFHDTVWAHEALLVHSCLMMKNQP